MANKYEHLRAGTLAIEIYFAKQTRAEIVGESVSAGTMRRTLDRQIADMSTALAAKHQIMIDAWHARADAIKSADPKTRQRVRRARVMI